MFDWPVFLCQHNIEYVPEGREDIAVRCPFCGGDDPSHHMGISLRGKGWYCWRQPQVHKGKSRSRLIRALLGCSVEQANRLAYGDRMVPTDEDIVDSFRKQLDLPTVSKRLELPREFKPLSNPSIMARPFRTYLYERGYSAKQVEWLTKTYDLHYTTSGEFKYRVIIPVHDPWGRLLTWTGRAISPNEELRYLALTKERAVCSTKATLLGLPLLWHCERPKALLVCEGPFDAMRITMFGRSFGVYATCVFGLALSTPQTELLYELKERFSYIGLLLDAAAHSQAFGMLAAAGHDLGLRRVKMPEGYKDPAELPPQQVIDLCLSIL